MRREDRFGIDVAVGFAFVAVLLAIVSIGIATAGRSADTSWVTVLMAEKRIVVEDAVPDDTVLCFDSAGRYCRTVGAFRAEGLFVLPERGGR